MKVVHVVEVMVIIMCVTLSKLNLNFKSASHGRVLSYHAGVESAEPDLKNSLVSVTGVIETDKLVEYVYKRTGKQAVIVKQEPEKKEEAKEGAAKEEKKGEEGGDKDQKGGGGGGEGEGENNKEKKEGGGGGDQATAGEGGAEETKVVELKKNEYYYNPPRYGMEFYAYPGPAYPPQIFSDENPNACSVM